MRLRLFLLTLLFLFLHAPWVCAQGHLRIDSLVNLVMDGDFDLPCIEDAVYLPYRFENNGHNNSPDLVVFQPDSSGGMWYWDEFGCLKDRYFLPFLPLHYACCRMRQEPPLPPAWSGNRYACLIREPQVDEALVYELQTPILPGQPYRIFFAARAMSPFCPRPSMRVSVSSGEPCRSVVNSLEDHAVNTCRDNRTFQPLTVLLTDTLALQWTPMEHFLIAPDTLRWVIFSAGPVDTTQGLPYLGLDDIQVNLLPIPAEVTAPVTPHAFGDLIDWTLTFRNPYPITIPDYPVIFYPDDKLALLDGPEPDSLHSRDGWPLRMTIPAGTPGHPGQISKTLQWRSLSDCPMHSQVVFGQRVEDQWPFRIGIQQPNPSPIIYISDSTQTLSAAISQGLLPPDSIRGQEIYINHDFHLDSPSYRFIDCLIRVRWGSQLIIPKDGILSLIRTEFQGCGQPWESLRIMDEAELYLEDSMIRDAKTAVQYRQGAILHMRGSNLEGVQMDLNFEEDPVPPSKRKTD